MTNRPMVDAAKSLVSLGWPVFPCKPDKSPLTPHGFKDATTDQQQIDQWWTAHPNAMIGMPTGAASGCFVVDVDIDPEKGIDGNQALLTV